MTHRDSFRHSNRKRLEGGGEDILIDSLAMHGMAGLLFRDASRPMTVYRTPISSHYYKSPIAFRIITFKLESRFSYLGLTIAI